MLFLKTVETMAFEEIVMEEISVIASFSRS